VSTELLAVIAARGGSKGLPGKNTRMLAGLPLIEHSLRLAALCPEIVRTIVSTDSEEIASVARRAGADVPFLRPPELAGDETPTWPVVQHALEQVDPAGERFSAVLLLDPTSPGRLPEDVAGAARLLEARADVDGVIGVSEPHFNPIWTAVVERDGRLEPLLPEAVQYERRQDVPRVLRINAAIYLWRASFVRASRGESWLDAHYLPWEIPERRAFHIDTADDFELAELLLSHGFVTLPWLE
jgi:N-acylneuraminate cytidylyltransferase